MMRHMKVRNLRQGEIVMWLLIVALMIISVLAGYLLWAKISLHSPS